MTEGTPPAVRSMAWNCSVPFPSRPANSTDIAKTGGAAKAAASSANGANLNIAARRVRCRRCVMGGSRQNEATWRRLASATSPARAVAINRAAPGIGTAAGIVPLRTKSTPVSSGGGPES